MARNEGPTWLLYDGDCRICSAFAASVDALDLRGRIRIQSIQRSRGLLRAIPSDEILEAVHAVAPDGHVATGPDALTLVFSALLDGPGLEVLLRSSPPATAAVSRLYRLLVEFRGHLSCRYDAPSLGAHIPR